ncbi:condensation domain-containing protein, partial [Kitasatospora sp. NPDC054939]
MVLQAGVASLLSRLGAGEDVPIGAPVAGRTDAALDELVGFFVNTLVLRTDVSGEPTFRELLGRVRETDLRAFAHQELPFERLVEELNPARSLARHPLFQVMLNLQNQQEGSIDLPGITSTLEPIDAVAAKFDLSFTAVESAAEGLLGAVEYAVDLFDPATAQSFADRLVRLLEAVAADPDLPVGAVDLLAPGEEERILRAGTGADADLSEATLPDLVEATVARTPDAPAVEFGEEVVSYRELNARANRLAHRLIERGVGPESVVAVSLPRSVDLVVALLAVLKAGGAYLPVDPDHPQERVEFMLQDSRAALLLDPAALAAEPVAEPV